MPIYTLANGTVIAASNLGYQTLNVPAPPSGYDFATAIAAVPFTINQPAAPTITTEATCTTVAEVNTSLAVNGRRTIIAAGTYNFGGAVSIGGNDKQIVCQPGAVLNLTEFQPTSATRIQIDDAVINATGQYGIRFTSSQDIAFNGLVLDGADSGFITFSTTRVRFLSSEVTGAVHAGYLDIGNSHFTIANSNFVSTQPFGGINGWCIRWGDGTPTAMVLMDSRFRCEQNVTLRYEVIQQDGYFARNQIEGNNPFRTEGRDSGTPATWPLDNLHFIDNQMYPFNETGPFGVIVTSFPRMTNVVATGNTTRGPGSGLTQVGFPTGQSTWTVSGNTNVVTALGPPTWVMQ